MRLGPRKTFSACEDGDKKILTSIARYLDFLGKHRTMEPFLAMHPERLYRNAFHTADVNHCQTVGRSELPEHPMNMIADSVFGELKLGGNLLIGHTTRYQPYQLLLAIRQPQFTPSMEAWHLILPRRET